MTEKIITILLKNKEDLKVELKEVLKNHIETEGGESGI